MSNRARTTAQRRADSNNNNHVQYPPLRNSDGNDNSDGDARGSSKRTNLDDSDVGNFDRNGQGKNNNNENGNPSKNGKKIKKDKDKALSAVTAQSSLLQPRVAVVLGVSETWHPLLFACRLLSTVPAIWWGFPSGLRLLASLHLMVFSERGRWGGLSSLGGMGGSSNCDMSFEARLRLTETLLATIWCGASAYLSFFFTDCLMSRWLLNYTPQATLVRLLTINALNGYLTSWVLYLTGGSADPRLLLPAWIGISTTLTVMYHVTQRKINIRKETSMSISVFSIASFISMVALLAQLHSNRSDYPAIPLMTFTKTAWHELNKAALKVMEYSNVTREL